MYERKAKLNDRGERDSIDESRKNQERKGGNLMDESKRELLQ